MNCQKKAEQFLGPGHAERILKLVEAEAQRQWHIERSKPKQRTPRPVGRPWLSPEARNVREIGKQLANTYMELKQKHPLDYFETRHGEDHRRLIQAIEQDDLDTLMRLSRINLGPTRGTEKCLSLGLAVLHLRNRGGPVKTFFVALGYLAK